MDHKKVAQRVLKYVGQDNIQAAAHCATRLRLVLKDDKAIDQKGLDNDPDVKGTFETDGQYQIIIGPGDVNKVYDQMVQMANLKTATTDDLKKVAANKKHNPILDLFKLLSDIFIPIIPALVAGGLLMALNNVLTAQHLFAAKSLVQMNPQLNDFANFINMLASAPFTFLPVLICMSATKRFGGSRVLGATMGFAMVMPQLISGYAISTTPHIPAWNFFGLHVLQAGYQGQVLPVLGVAYILATIEKFCHKHLKSAIDFTFTPMIAIIVTGFLTFSIVGPVLRAASDWLTNGIIWFYNTTGWFGMGLFGLFYSAIVITGLHQTFPAIETQLLANIAKTGGSFFLPVAAMANLGQGAATAAVWLTARNAKQKSLAGSSAFSAMLGITEPAIFGVNLKLKYPFICGAIASGISSAVLGLFHVLSISMGPCSLISFICIKPGFIPQFLLGMVIDLIVGFAITFVYAKRYNAKHPEENEDVADETVNEINVNDEVITAPISGKVESLKDTNDKVFSSEMMGKGAAIIPESNEVVAPADGTITVSYPTGHAYGIKTSDGADILIHLGIDTVNLKGKGFESSIKQGDKVKKGDLLGTYDYELVKKEGYDPTVMVVVTNTNDYAEVKRITNAEVKQNDNLIALTEPSTQNKIATAQPM
ncbi:sucrose-specific PTS transporter subunit IIBC [Lactobacillus helveticus]|uniref:protein-N(pi)-phosphohistidine--sucrose phosphotransferase n=1 Tax=Lactobacillus helveticus TaxID=1587 RepID=A0A8H9F8P6_LACHE|nr:sucrose-specific PTS transporter subunit IIBC [Lactobacillus helveticus]MBW8061092.1 PTS beta-glucoside transporter subunit IIBCA [Lactobacillus helveticus]GFO99262.1 PTS beta-glucoside transporter subunit EIIBCA [Lactobacillus helveticus]GFP00238.1 PTS beta-glucoside transporter subunit EIIBCA [Lactobacillus helveticus]GFP03298.1 PTS beta-glucoside transporter subunit EIIBCA [Lactobacillus helveticus]GFP04396.1 PTS beta-glucoside transporter subunit EIIBCA [Lactobacillus helveticus]